MIKESEEWCDGGGRRSREEVVEAGGVARWLAELEPFPFPSANLFSLGRCVERANISGATERQGLAVVTASAKWRPQRFRMHLPFLQRKDVILFLVDLTSSWPWVKALALWLTAPTVLLYKSWFYSVWLVAQKPAQWCPGEFTRFSVHELAHVRAALLHNRCFLTEAGVAASHVEAIVVAVYSSLGFPRELAGDDTLTFLLVFYAHIFTPPLTIVCLSSPRFHQSRLSQFSPSLLSAQRWQE